MSSSVPFSSSVPMLSSSTRGVRDAEHGARIGRAHDRELDQVAARRIRCWRRGRASRSRSRRASAAAPASAGRSIPGMVRSASLDIAISAPVLPAETAASALALLHRVDRHAHRGGLGAADRLARLFVAARSRRANGRCRRAGRGSGWRLSSARDRVFVAEQDELRASGRAAARARRRRSSPPGRCRRPSRRWRSAGPPVIAEALDALQASAETISRPL